VVETEERANPSIFGCLGALAAVVGFVFLGFFVCFVLLWGCSGAAICNGAPAVKTLPAQASCDDGFTASRFKIKLLSGARFDFVNAHLPSGGGGAACRADQLNGVFSESGATLIAGDLNLDPYAGTDASEVRFRELVGPGAAFKYHSGIAEHDPPHPSAFYLSGNSTLDHVVSNFAKGACTTLGVAAGTSRLDKGSGTDHRALFCELTVP
jgi:endonuclease/exonuclease/phosphatase family metal-dependent hydrolase